MNRKSSYPFLCLRLISPLVLIVMKGHQAGLHLGFCSKGGKIAVSTNQGRQALHAVHYNIYI